MNACDICGRPATRRMAGGFRCERDKGQLPEREQMVRMRLDCKSAAISTGRFWTDHRELQHQSYSSSRKCRR